MNLTTPPCPVSTLYRDHHGWLQGWLQRRLGCAAQAADLAQDTFVRILNAWERKGDPGMQQPRAYLTTVAHGLMVNWLQRQALERAYLEALAALPEPLAPSPEERLLILETLHEVDALLDDLPPRVKQAFLLAQIEGRRYDEIAGLIGVSLPTVKRYMKQAFVQCLRLMP